MPSQVHSSAGQLGGTLPQFWMHQASSAAVCPTTAAHEPASGSGEGSGDGESFLASLSAACCSSRLMCSGDLVVLDALLLDEPVLLDLGAALLDALVDEWCDDFFAGRWVSGFWDSLARTTAEAGASA